MTDTSAKINVTKKVSIAALMLLIVLSAQSSVLAAPEANTLTNVSSFLRTDGTYIRDGLGNFVLLRGVNIWPGAIYYADKLPQNTETDYKKIASWGFTAVRLPTSWDLIEPQPGKYDEAYLSKYVDTQIAWAKKYGLYVILDMHQLGWSPYFTYAYKSGATGLPKWAVSAYANNAGGERQAKMDFWNSLGPNGSAPSQSNLSMQDRFLAMWKFVAARYSSENIVAGYDLFNEPGANDMNTMNWASKDYDKFASITVPAFLARVVDAIRSVDSNHVIFWEPARIWPTQTGYLDRPNVIYSPHYPGGWSLIDGYDGNNTLLATSLDTLLHQSYAWNQPLFIGEWGIRAEARNADRYTHDLSDLMDMHFVSSAWWAFARDSFGMYLLNEKGVERAVFIRNLVRPHITFSSSGPISSSYDSGQLRVTVKGPSAVIVYLPTGESVDRVATDSGPVSWHLSSQSVVVDVPVEASQVSIYFK